MQKENQLTKKTGALTEETYTKLRRLRATLVLTMILMCIISILCIAMPVAATYLVPLYAANGAVSILGFLREISQMNDNQYDTGSSAAHSGTLVTHTQSRSAYTNSGPTQSV